MKLLYSNQPVSRVGLIIPVQDVEDGERFKKRSCQQMYIGNGIYSRDGDMLLGEGGRVANSSFFEYNSGWMISLREGSRSLIVELV